MLYTPSSWLRGQESNLRPPGYEPGILSLNYPARGWGCKTPLLQEVVRPDLKGSHVRTPSRVEAKHTVSLSRIVCTFFMVLVLDTLYQCAACNILKSTAMCRPHRRGMDAYTGNCSPLTCFEPNGFEPPTPTCNGGALPLSYSSPAISNTHAAVCAPI